MANDSHHFRTAEDLRGEGCRLEGNVYVGHDSATCRCTKRRCSTSSTIDSQPTSERRRISSTWGFCRNQRPSKDAIPASSSSRVTGCARTWSSRRFRSTRNHWPRPCGSATAEHSECALLVGRPAITSITEDEERGDEASLLGETIRPRPRSRPSLPRQPTPRRSPRASIAISPSTEKTWRRSPSNWTHPRSSRGTLSPDSVPSGSLGGGTSADQLTADVDL